MVTIGCQAPTWTLVRLQPPEHQLYFAKTPILDLGAPTPKDFNPVQLWGSNPFGIHWCAAALFSASTAFAAPFASTASTISYSGYTILQQPLQFSVFCCFLYAPCLCPFISSFSLALWLPYFAGSSASSGAFNHPSEATTRAFYQPSEATNRAL